MDVGEVHVHYKLGWGVRVGGDCRGRQGDRTIKRFSTVEDAY
jgi:hypothetical protein